MKTPFRKTWREFFYSLPPTTSIIPSAVIDGATYPVGYERVAGMGKN
jgi:hypothetical protein